MDGRHKALCLAAAALLAISTFTLFSSPLVGASCAIAALLLSIYLKVRGAFHEGNTPLIGVLLLGGAGIMSVGGVLAVVSFVSVKAAIILFCLMTFPSFGFLILFGYRERWRGFQRWIEKDADKPPP
ncbi:MAG TPA: hypothetical protein VM146_10625 [Steroidobacteraceae bacterium]|nr:hypothetical protein [Steroidobacteraceae bacterium]